MSDIDMAEIDITHEVCPMTFVRTRLALDRLPAGGKLLVRLRGTTPLDNVLRSLKLLGHVVEEIQTETDGMTHRLTVLKSPAA
ncbi:sulfurtransferase TusA family protein [Komagataeibacter oboediens]|uniref:Sulfurtransferase TusA family protein n=1 Tax=Komagataeibacter oboediens TaxID=65958 RepID=A0ABS5SJ60_9PROT|nr:sulfurtransferase TusA family protein [Komagataeibacter oboediens]MBL7232503.1 sulfurtransferase TusA family protein [Komagataeibacter oboediens]MBT0674280.1 sulfurtransferase TusA family protein [Komagataeibacter oboediens]MBT0677931.1 sulfurtransferase TusA family protein [Komagataeibacter oboediens]